MDTEKPYHETFIDSAYERAVALNQAVTKFRDLASQFADVCLTAEGLRAYQRCDEWLKDVSSDLRGIFDEFSNYENTRPIADLPPEGEIVP